MPEALSMMAEGGRLAYRGIIIIGLRKRCETIKQCLDECWADDEVRQIVWGCGLRIIYVSRMVHYFGISNDRGEIAVDPSLPHPNNDVRNLIHVSGTVEHECIHE